jgi:acyl-homoserine-lactone acylase
MARIYRDEWGMPHVYADDEDDGFFALGYAQAEDRLHGIYRNQLLVEGRLASVLGPDALPVDMLSRCWLQAEAAAAAFERLPAQLQLDYEAFVAGIEAFATEHRDRVPAWAPELTPWLPYAVPRTLLWPPFMISDAARACLRAGVEPDPTVVGELHAVVTPVSNEWVLSGSRTASGAPMLLSDPHGDIAAFAQVFEFGLEAGAIKCSGVALLGVALPLLGFTRHLAWGFTTGGPLVSDCYRLRPTAPLRTLQASFEVAGGDPATRTFEYAEVNGVQAPIAARDESALYAICTPYMDDPELLDEQFYAWLRARDVSEFRAAMEPCAQFPQNTMVADTSGNTLYIRAGRTPVRAAGVDPSLPVDFKPEHAWRGVHPLSDLVQIENPAAEYMQNCNIGPDTMVAPVPDELSVARYLPYVYNDRPDRSNSRGDRARELLSSARGAGVDDALAIAVDARWPGVPRWQAVLRAAAESAPDVPPIVERLLAFDGEARAESVAALEYVHWRSALGWPTDGDTAAARRLVQAVDAGRELDDAQRHALIEAARRAAAAIRERYGERVTTYGDVFRLGPADASAPARGGAIMTHMPEINWELSDVVLAMEAPLRVFHLFGDPDEQGRRHALAGGRSLRLTVLREPVESYSVVLWGQSELPDSPHYADQATLASEAKVRRIHFTMDELRPHIVTELELPRRPG